MRLRLFLSFLLVAVVTLVSVVLFAALGTQRELQTFITRGGMFGGEELVTRLEEYFAAESSWVGVEKVFAAQGAGLHAGTTMGRGAGSGNMMARQVLILADTSGLVVYRQPANLPGENTLAEQEIAQSILISVDRQVVGYLYAANSTQLTAEIQEALLSRMNRAALTAAIFAGVISLALAALVGYFMLRPIHQLTGAAMKMAGGDFSQRVPISGKDEMSTLGKSFNYMAESLEKLETNRKAMSADIAHELRTPLAVQRANIEALQDGIFPLTPDNLLPLLEQNHQLERMVEDLRTLALADAGRLEFNLVTTNLPALIRRSLENYEPAAAHRGIEIIQKFSGTCPGIDLDPRRFEQVVTNLLSNALRYTPDGGRIEVVTTCEAGVLTAGTAQVSIHDSGPGIPTEALPYIFDRFYRADKSRNRGEGGTGLGLSIARRLVEAQQGKLEAANHPDGGAVFTIVLPLKRTL